MAQAICLIDDCENPATAPRGWCWKHYYRWYRHGDPLYRKQLRGVPPEVRFWPRVRKTETCWLWTGTINAQGYGLFSVEGANVGTHRIAYQLLVGPVPEGKELDHLCRVRHCVRPDHLEPVTTRENILRGNGMGGRNARKTHCPQGHPYDAVNTRWRHDGKGRDCIACERSRVRRSKHEQRPAGTDQGTVACL